MRKLLPVFLLVLLSLQLTHAREFDQREFTAAIEQGRSLWHVPGLAIAVVRNGEVELQRGLGHATPGGAAVAEHTLFANASTTKAMLVAGLLILADDERLSLDDPVIRHIPEVRFHETVTTDAVTIRDLLAHRTGLPRTDFWTFQQRMPLADQIERLRLVAPEAGPRERLLYQNTMYELAGLIVERIAGKPWYAFLEERLWRPIGMLETYGMRGQIPSTRTHVMPHMHAANGIRQIPFDLLADDADAAGSAWSSIHDMTLWAQFLLNDGVTRDGKRLISTGGIREMFEPQQLSNEEDFYPTVALTKPNWRTYGLGWFQQDFQGRKIDFHTGSLDGLVAIIGLDRANRDAVVVLQNMDGSELRHALLWEAFDQTPAATRRDWVADVFDLYAARKAEADRDWAETAAGRLIGTQPSLPMDKYFGTYRNAMLGDIEFAARSAADKAVVPIPARPDHTGPVIRTKRYEYEASHWHLDTFLLDYTSWSHGIFAEFDIAPDGTVSSLTINDDVFRRQD